MIVTIRGKSSTNPADSLYAGEPKPITKDCPTEDLTETVERWLRMGRTVDSITVKWDPDAEPTDTGEHEQVPSEAQIVAFRILSHRGVYHVEVEKMCGNSDVIVRQSYGNGHGAKLFRVEPDGRIHDDQHIGW